MTCNIYIHFVVVLLLSLNNPRVKWRSMKREKKEHHISNSLNKVCTLYKNDLLSWYSQLLMSSACECWCLRFWFSHTCTRTRAHSLSLSAHSTSKTNRKIIGRLHLRIRMTTWITKNVTIMRFKSFFIARHFFFIIIESRWNCTIALKQDTRPAWECR